MNSFAGVSVIKECRHCPRTLRESIHIFTSGGEPYSQFSWYASICIWYSTTRTKYSVNRMNNLPVVTVSRSSMSTSFYWRACYCAATWRLDCGLRCFARLETILRVPQPIQSRMQALPNSNYSRVHMHLGEPCKIRIVWFTHVPVYYCRRSIYSSNFCCFR